MGNPGDGDGNDGDGDGDDVLLLKSSQVRKLERDLQIAQRNTEVSVNHNIFHLTVHPKYHCDCPKVFNELLSELTPGEEHPEDRRLLHDVSGTCREMQVLLLTKCLHMM